MAPDISTKLPFTTIESWFALKKLPNTGQKLVVHASDLARLSHDFVPRDAGLPAGSKHGEFGEPAVHLRLFEVNKMYGVIGDLREALARLRSLLAGEAAVVRLEVGPFGGTPLFSLHRIAPHEILLEARTSCDSPCAERLKHFAQRHGLWPDHDEEDDANQRHLLYVLDLDPAQLLKVARSFLTRVHRLSGRRKFTFAYGCA